MEAIWTERWTLAQAATELGKSRDELAVQFAIFGVQAMEALRSKGVVRFDYLWPPLTALAMLGRGYANSW
jgi:hypothetical protein